jgi:anti-sigma regulatory factor (Ser/Thr protein kinase)
MDFFRVLGIPYDEDFERHASAGRFVPIFLVNGSSGWGAVRQIGDVILHQFENARDFFSAFEWAVSEVVDNILIHSDAALPGVVSAQFFPQKNNIQIGICDMGRGILKSLSESYHFESHSDAILKALERGVTRNTEVGQGNGLAGTLEIARANEGAFQIWSGDACFKLGTNGKTKTSRIPHMEGTGIYLWLRTDRPLNLTKTFIGDNSSTYLETECGRACSGGGLMVMNECQNTHSRLPAGAFRKKILNLLPELEGEPLIINFDRVKSASSSFLDELFSRLIVEIGMKGFRAQIKVINLDQTMQRLANVVIEQRLASTKQASDSAMSSLKGVQM